MNRNFVVSLLAVTLAYLFIPKISAIITLVAVTILIFQLAATLAGLVIHSSYCSTKLPPTNRMVLVTGCDSGFGLATARRLDRYGFYVLAGVLSKQSEGAKYLETNASKRLRTIKLDVTKQEDVDEAVGLIAYLTNYKPVLDKLNQKQSILGAFGRKIQNPVFGNEDGDLKLWAVVNNAGVAKFVPFEFGSIEQDLMPMFEVNVLGLIRVTKGVLPFLRQSQGRIVNVGSMAGRMTFGILTGYCMTKHAVRSFTDGLRQELHKFKIKPILIEPTLYKTPMSNTDQMIKQFETTFNRTEQTVRSEYGDEQYRDELVKHLKRTGVLTRTNIDEVVSSIEDAITSSVPRIQYLCASTPQKLAFWVLSMLSSEVADKLCNFRPPQALVDILQALNR